MTAFVKPDKIAATHRRQRPLGAVEATLRATSLWCILVVGSLVLLQLTEWRDVANSALWWLRSVVDLIGLAIPFALFAGGVALSAVLPRSRHLVRVAVVSGIALSALSYLLTAWVEPVVHYRYLISSESGTAARVEFGPQTPPGVLQNLRFVEENPLQEYSLSVDAPREHPPNVLRWILHRPAALAVFGLVNVFLGLLSAQLTAGLRRGACRNIRVAIGVVGGIAFFACVSIASPVEPFLRDGTQRSGVLSAWAPLVLPITQALLLYYLIRRRRG